ncbi:hypothetical protein ACFSOZ_23885 [Mesorhizobium newzealandense]|uniref:Core-binding (CB) domain-containing protein n=1 Tax=Mesorhizobium newzealandense TaxID=1300302 RepID=A0ABW4UH13_9HYPH
MTARWPDPDRATIDRYVASLGLRSMKSLTSYRQVLHGFQDVTERHQALNQEVLLAWLRESAIRRATSTLLHRTRIIDRFLERLVEIGAIEHNPVVALRDECNIKQCMPIWRALASRDPERALAELRQPRPFCSVLGENGRACRDDAAQRIQIHFATPVALAVRPVPAVASGTGNRTSERHDRSMGGNECHAGPRGGKRKAQARLCENPSSP